MAGENQNSMSVDDAYQTVLGDVYGSTFMSKLAANGIVPVNETEYENLFRLADTLRAVSPEKTASSRFGEALAALSEFAESSPLTQTAQAQAVKQAAASFVADPKIYEAMLTLLANEQTALAGNK